jgi:NAD(P)H dehydrogenase (quinone)
VSRSERKDITRRFVVVVCHPIQESFVRVAGDNAISALIASGHTVQVIDLDAEGFDPLLSAQEWQTGSGGLTEVLAPHASALRSATDLVLVYPTWFGGMPARLKGWFDRVWRQGVSWDRQTATGRPHGLLRNITHVWVVTSHGSGRGVNFAQGEGGLRFVRRTLRLSCSPWMRTRWVAFYGNDSANDADRHAFLERVTSVFSRV